MNDLLGVEALVAERGRFVDTVETLTDEDFDHGRTLCSAWAPRDVLVHLIGTGNLRPYLRAGLRVNAANAAIVAAGAGTSRAELTERGRSWAEHASRSDRLAARFLIGDVAVHHQDVLRGLGRQRDLPPDVAAAVYREGALLSSFTERNLVRHRVEPTDGHARPLGRGRTVRGATETLGLWLAGRRGLEPELELELELEFELEFTS